MESKQIRVLLFDDNHILRESLGKYILALPELNLVGSFPDALDVVDKCREFKPDVIIMDIDMPGVTGIMAVRMINDKYPNIKILMFTVFDEDGKVFQSICNGACGYMLKSADPRDIVQAIKDAYNGGAPMSPSIAIRILDLLRKQSPIKAMDFNLNSRELEVLSLLSKGYSYKMIAAECNICIDTVRFYIKKIYEKLQVHSMTEAVNIAIRSRLV